MSQIGVGAGEPGDVEAGFEVDYEEGLIGRQEAGGEGVEEGEGAASQSNVRGEGAAGVGEGEGVEGSDGGLFGGSGGLADGGWVLGEGEAFAQGCEDLGY